MGTGKKPTGASMAKISSMENQLSGILKPIAPRREFVQGLGTRMQVVNRVSLAVLLAMVARALLSLSGKKRTA
jgi:hypothetical protein